MTIDSYLLELERRLPRIAAQRPRAEVREHLRDAAAQHEARGLSRADAECAAVRDFGPVDEIAKRLGFEIALRQTRVAAALALGATALFVFPLYVVPENTLPPAPWLEKPRDIAVIQLVMVALWVAAGVLAAAATAVAWTRLSTFAAPMLTASLVALAGSLGAVVTLAVRWYSYTPSTPNWALAAPLAAVCLVVCAGAAAWARSSHSRLELSD
ncbi:MAG: permease prefix domain 1-containing protein [Gaiellaceae bacterium]